ncbi:MAG: HlyD family efflux transporter periplasmic adaptor subunit, partial [Betaproteobacteria bacterium]
LGALQENMLGLEAQQVGSKALLVQRRASLELLREQAQQTRALAEEGYLPRNRQLELDRQLSDLRGQISDLEAGIERGSRSVAEIRLRMEQRRSDYRKEVDTQLADVRREVEALEERLQAVKLELGRTLLRSPASGQVIGLMVQSPGAVIGPGMKVMDIVPEREALLVEARLPPQYIDRVRQEQEVDVRFSVFANTPQLVVPGKVISLSSDLISDAAGMSRQPGSPPEYYLVRVGLDDDVALSVLKHRRIQPGMPADVVIKTGERSLLRYLLRPLTKRIAASLKEE